MSKNCNYIYVQGLRFRPDDVKILWKDDSGFEHLVNLRKTGTGKAIFDEFDIPVTLTPKDLKKMLKKGETINVITYPTDGTKDAREQVMLRLDPRQAEGRKGRKAFDPAALAGLPPRGLRALALEQLKTAPYGVENRNEAVARMLWSLENLDDAAIAKMLEGERIGFTPVENFASAITPRSSTNVELAALLLSDERLVAALRQGGKHESLRAIRRIAPLAAAVLADTSRPANNDPTETGFDLDREKETEDVESFAKQVPTAEALGFSENRVVAASERTGAAAKPSISVDPLTIQASAENDYIREQAAAWARERADARERDLQQIRVQDAGIRKTINEVYDPRYPVGSTTAEILSKRNSALGARDAKTAAQMQEINERYNALDAAALAQEAKEASHRVEVLAKPGADAAQATQAPVSKYDLGQTGPAGGVVFAIKAGTYFEAAPEDVGNFAWEEAMSAAAKYTTTVPGTIYSDWHLPSKHELNAMYENRKLIGGFSTDIYWSSSEYDVNDAWFQNFATGSQYTSSKGIAIYVRPVRAFSI